MRILSGSELPPASKLSFTNAADTFDILNEYTTVFSTPSLGVPIWKVNSRYEKGFPTAMQSVYFVSTTLPDNMLFSNASASIKDVFPDPF